MTNSEMRELLLSTLEDVRAGNIDPKQGATIAKIASVALKSAIAEVQYGGQQPIDFFSTKSGKKK